MRRARDWRLLCVAGWVAALVAGESGSVAAAGDADSCMTPIADAETDNGIPTGLLKAIGFAESGRVANGQKVAWPWTVNAQGQGHYFETKEAAIAFVTELRQQGVEVIDVGCMQVNLYHHPQAFDSLEAAFDPADNVAYAAEFLSALQAETGDWGLATQYYHSRTPELGIAYGQRVAGVGGVNGKRLRGIQVTLNAYGRVISSAGPVKHLSDEERAALAAELPELLANAQALIEKSRAMRQSMSAGIATSEQIAAVPTVALAAEDSVSVVDESAPIGRGKSD